MSWSDVFSSDDENLSEDKLKEKKKKQSFLIISVFLFGITILGTYIVLILLEQVSNYTLFILIGVFILVIAIVALIAFFILRNYSKNKDKKK